MSLSIMAILMWYDDHIIMAILMLSLDMTISTLMCHPNMQKYDDMAFSLHDMII